MEPLTKDVIWTIKERGIVPKPRWQFLVRRSVFLSSAFLSVIAGGIAFSVADYIFFDNEGVGSTTLLESPMEWILHTVPFVWLAAFLLFVASAAVSLRKTRSGYRYRVVFAAGSVIICAGALGFALNNLDFGQTAHDYLLSHTTFYDALIYSSDDRTKSD